MTAASSLLFLWHMHQPDYREQSTEGGSIFVQPWVYLHALKDYADMAAHLERHSDVCAVVNFSSTLLDQLADYSQQFAGGTPRDPLLLALVRDGKAPLTMAERKYIGDQCFRIKRETMVRAYRGYAELEAQCVAADHGDDTIFEPLAESFFYDLVTWYHIAWCGESLKRTEPLLKRLMNQGRGYTFDDRLALFDLVKRVVCGILPRYASLAATGQIELSLTPHGHPIAPLLMDFGVAKEAEPGALLPNSHAYPGGDSRVQWHIERARTTFRRCFDREPAGMWPAEAAVSEAFVDLARGFRWIACDELTLRKSIGATDQALPSVPWRWGKSTNPIIFPRNNKVSEFLSFEYSRRTPAEAASHLIEGVRELVSQEKRTAHPLVAIILDGENAWEHYEGNAYDFFETLYTRLESETDVRTVTASSYLDRAGAASAIDLPRLAPGSWAGNGFGMWIGDERRNAAWDALVRLKEAFDATAPSLPIDRRSAAEEALARCESSDWLWWMGFDEPVDAVLAFDKGFQRALAATYECLGLVAPAGPRAFSRLGHMLHEPVQPLDLAKTLAKTIGMEMTVEVPEGIVSWGAQPTSPEMDQFLTSQGTDGWMFAVPGIQLPGALKPTSFKYAEVKIALEKSNVRFFEGRALLTSQEIEPGLLIIGVDKEGAQRLTNRFRLPAVIYASKGEASSLLSFTA